MGGGFGGGMAAPCTFAAQDCAPGTCFFQDSSATSAACAPGVCNLARQDCGPGLACVPSLGEFATGCEPAGTAAPGEPCMGGGCAARSLCAIGPDQQGHCLPLCFEPGDCPPGWTCGALVEIQGRFLSMCLPP